MNTQPSRHPSQSLQPGSFSDTRSNSMPSYARPTKSSSRRSRGSEEMGVSSSREKMKGQREESTPPSLPSSIEEETAPPSLPPPSSTEEEVEDLATFPSTEEEADDIATSSSTEEEADEVAEFSPNEEDDNDLTSSSSDEERDHDAPQSLDNVLVHGKAPFSLLVQTLGLAQEAIWFRLEQVAPQTLQRYYPDGAYQVDLSWGKITRIKFDGMEKDHEPSIRPAMLEFTPLRNKVYHPGWTVQHKASWYAKFISIVRSVCKEWGDEERMEKANQLRLELYELAGEDV